eukprot:2894479-Prymnesium_polylepis.1
MLCVHCADSAEHQEPGRALERRLGGGLGRGAGSEGASKAYRRPHRPVGRGAKASVVLAQPCRVRWIRDGAGEHGGAAAQGDRLRGAQQKRAEVLAAVGATRTDDDRATVRRERRPSPTSVPTWRSTSQCIETSECSVVSRGRLPRQELGLVRAPVALDDDSDCSASTHARWQGVARSKRAASVGATGASSMEGDVVRRPRLNWRRER